MQRQERFTCRNCLLESNEQTLSSKYQTILPNKKELKQLIENKENELTTTANTQYT